MTVSPNYFLLIRDIRFLGASLFFTIRISKVFLFLLCAFNKLTKSNQPTTQPTSRSPSIYLPSEKSPELQTSHNHSNYLQLAKPHPCWSVRQTVVSCREQSEAVLYSTGGVKTKTYSQNISISFEETKMAKLSL